MVESAKKQKDVNIEYILIDNTEKQFSSGASALNYGVSLANHDCLVFTHQDIEFWMNMLYSILLSIAPKILSP